MTKYDITYQICKTVSLCISGLMIKMINQNIKPIFCIVENLLSTDLIKHPARTSAVKKLQLVNIPESLHKGSEELITRNATVLSSAPRL